MAVVGDEVRRVRAALEELPVEQRRALLLTALGGRSAREVGELEEIPLGTAKTRIRTALIRVRDTLAAEGSPE
jgi:RNA polymerase sigma-70 factor (ECF subfamily)